MPTYDPILKRVRFDINHVLGILGHASIYNFLFYCTLAVSLHPQLISPSPKLPEILRAPSAEAKNNGVVARI